MRDYALVTNSNLPGKTRYDQKAPMKRTHPSLISCNELPVVKATSDNPLNLQDYNNTQEYFSSSLKRAKVHILWFNRRTQMILWRWQRLKHRERSLCSSVGLLVFEGLSQFGTVKWLSFGLTLNCYWKTNMKEWKTNDRHKKSHGGQNNHKWSQKHR